MGQKHRRLGWFLLQVRFKKGAVCDLGKLALVPQNPGLLARDLSGQREKEEVQGMNRTLRGLHLPPSQGVRVVPGSRSFLWASNYRVSAAPPSTV